jgi:hypothetical protein
MHLTSPGSGPSARFVLKCVIQDERSLDQHKFRQNVDARKCSRPDTSRVEVHCQEIGGTGAVSRPQGHSGEGPVNGSYPLGFIPIIIIIMFGWLNLCIEPVIIRALQWEECKTFTRASPASRDACAAAMLSEERGIFLPPQLDRMDRMSQ